jgi:bis(5'-nucleosidyl)-tetraphosphatase
MKENRHCFGIIPIKFSEKEPRLFLVHHKKGHWAFPKGHPEEGESPKQTAQRELAEETGLQVIDFLPLNPIEEFYAFEEGGVEIQKTVTYFFAKVNGKIDLQEIEIVDAAWLTVEEAKERVTFDEARALCNQIKESLKHSQDLANS